MGFGVDEDLKKDPKMTPLPWCARTNRTPQCLTIDKTVERVAGWDDIKNRICRSMLPRDQSGNCRRNLFTEKKSGEASERTLGEAATRYGWRVHAYMVMRIHFHLAVELTEPNEEAKKSSQLKI